MIGEFIEVETGKGKDALSKRPELVKALAHAKREGATVLIAKLDRLSRNVHFISGLLESKVKFIACDVPEMNELTVHLLAAVAQYEGKRISERTKAALAAAKARGVVLGSPQNLKPWNSKEHAKAVEFASKVKPLIAQIRKEGLSQRKIVDRLNQLGVKTSEGSEWRLITLQRVLSR